MLCSSWILPFDCFVLRYCGTSHFDLGNYPFFEYFEPECEASHLEDHVICRNYLYANFACVQLYQKNQESNASIARPRNASGKKAYLPALGRTYRAISFCRGTPYYAVIQSSPNRCDVLKKFPFFPENKFMKNEGQKKRINH